MYPRDISGLQLLCGGIKREVNNLNGGQLNIMIKPYGKAMGISLLIHSGLFAILVVFGHMVEPVSYATPIEVTFASESVVDIGTTLTDSNPPAVDSHAVSKPTTTTTTTTSSEQLQKQILPKGDAPRQQQIPLPNTQVGDIGVEQAPVTGLAVGSSPIVNGRGDNYNPGKGTGEQSVKSLVRTKASHLSGGRPAYPYEARHASWEGTVAIRILVGTDGSPIRVAVSGSSGYSVLDEAAVQAVKNWTFSPARQGETPIESYYDVRVKFNLDDE